MLFTIIETPEDEEYECPDPREKSTIIFKVEYIDGKEWDIEDIDHVGGAAAFEAEFGIGMIETLKDLLGTEDVAKLEEQEWFIIEGFETYYSQDYYGEVDCEHYFDTFRKATQEDIDKFYGDSDESC